MNKKMLYDHHNYVVTPGLKGVDTLAEQHYISRSEEIIDIVHKLRGKNLATLPVFDLPIDTRSIQHPLAVSTDHNPADYAFGMWRQINLGHLVYLHPTTQIDCEIAVESSREAFGLFDGVTGELVDFLGINPVRLAGVEEYPYSNGSVLPFGIFHTQISITSNGLTVLRVGPAPKVTTDAADTTAVLGMYFDTDEVGQNYGSASYLQSPLMNATGSHSLTPQF